MSRTLTEAQLDRYFKEQIQRELALLAVPNTVQADFFAWQELVERLKYRGVTAQTALSAAKGKLTNWWNVVETLLLEYAKSLSNPPLVALASPTPRFRALDTALKNLGVDAAMVLDNMG